MQSHATQRYWQTHNKIEQCEKEGKGHPTQKPVAVMEWLIEHLTNENDVVFDPFMGSGSTGVACKNLNRSFIGYELEEEYFSISKKRILGGKTI